MRHGGAEEKDAEPNDMPKALKICSSIEEAFQISKTFHRNRLAKKFKSLQTNASLDSRKATSHHEDLAADLTNSLNKEELDLLSKGPKFALSTAIVETDVQANFCLLANQLRWKQFFAKKEKTTITEEVSKPKLPRYPNNDSIYEPPSSNPDLEANLKLCFYKIQGIMSKAKKDKPMENLPKQEKSALKSLKSKKRISGADLNSAGAQMATHSSDSSSTPTVRENCIDYSVCCGSDNIQAIRLQCVETLYPRLFPELAFVGVIHNINAKKMKMCNGTVCIEMLGNAGVSAVGDVV